MSKRITPAKSAAKRASYQNQRQQFVAGRGKKYGATIAEKRVVRMMRDEMAQCGWAISHVCGHWIAI